MPTSKNDKSSFRADYHQKSSGKRSNSSHSRPTALVDRRRRPSKIAGALDFGITQIIFGNCCV
jgi:hypothetical protein